MVDTRSSTTPLAAAWPSSSATRQRNGHWHAWFPWAIGLRLGPRPAATATATELSSLAVSTQTGARH